MTDWRSEVCEQCGTNDPMNDKLGWLEVSYAYAPEWHRRFCGSTCLHQWYTDAFTRLTGAMLSQPVEGA